MHPIAHLQQQEENHDLLLPPRAQRSLQRLADMMGEEVLQLPIEIFDDANTPYPAYTTPHAIHIGQSVVDHEPHRINVYVAHEILHHVIYDPLASALYQPDVVNSATDYIINYVLKLVYGLDVRKVNHAGLYSGKFRSRDVLGACIFLTKRAEEYEAEKTSACGCDHTFADPLIVRLAHRVAEQLQERPELAHLNLGNLREIVTLDGEDLERQFQELNAHFARLTMRRSAPLDMEMLLRAVYGRLAAKTVRYDIRRDMPELSLEHTIALGLRVDKLRKMTRNDPPASILFTEQIIDTLMSWGTTSWKEMLIAKQEERIKQLRTKIKERRRFSKYERIKFKESIKRARRKIGKLRSEVPLSSLLYVENRARVRAVAVKNSTGAELMGMLEIKDDHLPRLRPTDLSHWTRRVARTVYRHLAELYTMHGRIEDFIQRSKKKAVSSIIEHDDSHSPRDQTTHERQVIPQVARGPILPTQQELERQEKQAAKDEAKAERAAERAKKARTKLLEKLERENARRAKKGLDPLPIPPEDGAQQEEDEDENEDGAVDADETVSDSETEIDEDSEQAEPAEAMPDGTIDVSLAAGGRGMGGEDTRKETTAEVDLRTLDSVRTNMSILKKILIEADVFSEKLANASRSQIDLNAVLDRTLTFGDDVQRADTSALVKLAHEHTKLAFYADLANHSLLQNSGTEPRRGSVIIALDCSGSMAGDPYVIGAGFALAVLRAMTETNRGCALIKFASNVDGMYVCDVGVPVDMSTLIQALTTPSFGGTDFNCALSQAVLIQDTFNWQNTQMILVTDGHGKINNRLMAEASKRMRVTALSVGYQSILVQGVADAKRITSLDQLRAGLVTLGRAVL